jgi:orotidine-5'-phosphate decarboxylase
MTREELISQIKSKQSFLCTGLDTDLEKIPQHLKQTADPIFEFNKQIIQATSDVSVAYKPNLAFYECHGAQGWESLEKSMNEIPKECFTIADAKRGDIGNTSTYYAKTFFERYNFDAVTVAPYMGADSVLPFLEFDNKWVILLALTSNKGANDFQFHEDGGVRLFEKVINTAVKWGREDNLMFVVGATRPEMFRDIRSLVPDHFLLVPGVGAQGGELSEVARYGMSPDCGLLVNSSRGILYADQGESFADASRKAAQSIQQDMAEVLSGQLG